MAGKTISYFLRHELTSLVEKRGAKVPNHTPLQIQVWLPFDGFGMGVNDVAFAKLVPNG